MLVGLGDALNCIALCHLCREFEEAAGQARPTFATARRAQLVASLDVAPAGLPGTRAPQLAAGDRTPRPPTPIGTISTADAVSRFCNAEDGGVVIVGMDTSQRSGVEVIRSVRPVPLDGKTARRYRQAIENSRSRRAILCRPLAGHGATHWSGRRRPRRHSRLVRLTARQL